MSDHCQHCEGCREGFGYAGNGLVYSREALIYDGWAHHCFIDGAGYLHWDDGRCPLCATAQLERAAIVAWLVGYGLPQVANQIDNGLHLAGDDE